jgi:uncharacterized protein
MSDKLSRRKFIKGTIGAGIALSSSGLFLGCGQQYESKGIPTVTLGKTGVKVPRLSLGLGSRFCEISDPEMADQLLNYAIDNGMYYWDTAYSYVNNKNGVVSEERVGRIFKDRRKEVFISTKVASREPDEAMRQIETSLKRMNTDYVDILKVHSVTTMEDVEKASEKGGVVELLYRMKEEGVARFIGFSGHTDSEAMKAMAERHNFDTMLIALNQYGNTKYQREEVSVPAAHAKGMGVITMKLVRPRETDASLSSKDLIRYGLSVKGAQAAVIGTDSMKVLNDNIALLKNFTPMTADEMKTMTARLNPLYEKKQMPWMKPGYHDGYWA